MSEPSSSKARDAFLVGHALVTGRARSGHAEGDVESARGALLTAIRADDPEWSPRASCTLGEFLLRQGDADGAREALTVALRADHPEWTPAAQIVAGVIATGRGDRDAALAAYRVAIESGHRLHAPAAWFNLGTLHQQAGAVDDAISAFERAMTSDHQELRAKAAVNLGFVLFAERGDREGARRAFEVAVATGHPTQSELARQNLAALGPAPVRSGDAASAVLDGAITDVWAPAADLSARGAALEAADDLRGAAEAHAAAAERYRALLDGGVDDPVRVQALLSQALSSLAGVLARQGRFDHALEPAREAVQILDPLATEDPEVWTDAHVTLLVTLSGIEAMAGQIDAALRTSARAGALVAAASPPLPQLTQSRAARTIAEVRLRAGIDLDVAEIAVNRCIAALAELVRADPVAHRVDLYAVVELRAALLDRLDAGAEAAALRAWAAERHLDTQDGATAELRPHAVAAAIAAIVTPRMGQVADTDPLDLHGGDSAEAVAASETGLAAFEQGDLDASELHLRRADELGGRGGTYRLGFLLEERGDLTGAEEAYRRAVSRGSEAAAGNLATLLRRRGDRDGARRCYEIALALGSPRAQRELASMGYTVISGPDRFVVEAPAFDEIAATIMDDARAGQPLPPRMQVPGATEAVAGAIATTLLGNALHAKAVHLAASGSSAEGAANEAENHYREAFARAGSSRVRYAIAYNLGLLLTRFPDPMHERVHLLRLAQSSGHPQLVGRAGRVLAAELTRRGHLTDAASALQLAADAGHPEESPAAMLQLAALATTAGDREGARRAFTRAAQSGHPVHARQAAAALQQMDAVEGPAPAPATTPDAESRLSRLWRRRRRR